MDEKAYQYSSIVLTIMTSILSIYYLIHTNWMLLSFVLFYYICFLILHILSTDKYTTISQSIVLLMIISLMMMIISYFITGNTIITDLIFILFMPFIICFYGIKGYYEDEHYLFVAMCWLILLMIKIGGDV
ncbi:MAG: hypothetical protein LUG12_12110 [Erysipelotrichaceae bacterium]|nr:hypothetical protein [Erysipelotrichaceae bacterium]